MKFGVCEQVLHTRLGPMAMAESGYRTAGIGGADSYWLPDHLNSLLPQAVMTAKYSGAARLAPDIDAFLEPWTALGYLAGRHRFNRARLGTCVTDTGRRNPAVTAQAAATLHLMTRGRAILGIGTGEREGNEPHGVDWSKPVARFEEALATIRALWNSNGQLVNRDSEWFPLRNASFRLPPYKGAWPEIWIASHGPRMLRATGRYADGWFPVGLLDPRTVRRWVAAGPSGRRQCRPESELHRCGEHAVRRDRAKLRRSRRSFGFGSDSGFRPQHSGLGVGRSRRSAPPRRELWRLSGHSAANVR